MMKSLFRHLSAAALLLAAVTLQAGPIINPYAFSAPVLTFSLTDSEQQAATVGSSHTFSNCALGAAAADRRVVVCVGYRDGSPHLSPTVTIGGVSATVHIVTKSTSGTIETHAVIASAAVPTGTTGDVAIGNIDALNWLEMDVFRVVGGGATVTDADGGNNSDAPAATVDTAANGLAFACAVSSATGPNVAWSNITEATDRNTATDNDTFSSAVIATTGSSLTATATMAGSSSSDNAMSVVTLAP